MTTVLMLGRCLVAIALTLSLAGLAGAGEKPDASTGEKPDASTRQALERVLEDTRAAEQFYTAVVERHGQIRPFLGILEAEKRQGEALAELAKSRGMESELAGANVGAPPKETLQVPDTIKDACSAATDIEKRTVALYDEIIPKVTDSAVRENLEAYREATAARQLPAFESCVASGGPPPAIAAAAEYCESCGMRGCGCSQGAATAAPESSAPKAAHSCGCMRQRQ